MTNRLFDLVEEAGGYETDLSAIPVHDLEPIRPQDINEMIDEALEEFEADPFQEFYEEW